MSQASGMNGKMQQSGKASRKAGEGRRRTLTVPQPRSLLQQFLQVSQPPPEPLTRALCSL